jgi:hypothetical protein
MGIGLTASSASNFKMNRLPGMKFLLFLIHLFTYHNDFVCENENNKSKEEKVNKLLRCKITHRFFFSSLEFHVGWDKQSYGYHGDDGNSFCSSGNGQPYGPTFTTGTYT